MIATLWDPDTGSRVRRIRVTAPFDQEAQTGYWINVVRLSPDGALVAAGASDGILRLYDVATGNESHAAPADQGEPSVVRFSPDGTLAATGGPGGELSLIDVQSGRPIGRRIRASAGFVLDAVFHPSGRMALASWTDLTRSANCR